MRYGFLAARKLNKCAKFQVRSSKTVAATLQTYTVHTYRQKGETGETMGKQKYVPRLRTGQIQIQNIFKLITSKLSIFGRIQPEGLRNFRKTYNNDKGLVQSTKNTFSCFGFLRGVSSHFYWAGLEVTIKILIFNDLWKKV